MRVCPSCNKPILEDSEVCLFCDKKVEVEESKPRDTSSIQKDIKDWRLYEIAFTFGCLVFIVFGTLSILRDLAVWYTIFCFVVLAICLTVTLCSYRKINDLKRRLRGQ